MLDQGAAKRLADERYAALMRDLAGRTQPFAYEQGPQDVAVDEGYDGYPLLGYAPAHPRHRHPPRDKLHEPARHSAAPSPPYPIPRP